ncbi:hypothetical protein L1987_03217 [Smallanthus sonchifolius]|uniref:Uncharacterized protein n=1 Tax=Smallanthus sonchifolius TaxID=185202 RepID=A0ACB9KA54_9ASTR|nr:hypothetical protein L1987_03217 [Smallanthus sonchifolius]
MSFVGVKINGATIVFFFLVFVGRHGSCMLCSKLEPCLSERLLPAIVCSELYSQIHRLPRHISVLSLYLVAVSLYLILFIPFSFPPAPIGFELRRWSSKSITCCAYMNH